MHRPTGVQQLFWKKFFYPSLDLGCRPCSGALWPRDCDAALNSASSIVMCSRTHSLQNQPKVEDELRQMFTRIMKPSSCDFQHRQVAPVRPQESPQQG